MTFALFNLCLSIFFLFWVILDFESLMTTALKLDNYLTISYRFLVLVPSIVKMFVVRYYMLWKLKRQFKTSLFKPF